MKFAIRIITCFLLLTLQVWAGENWPGWRGTHQDGKSGDATPPLSWDAETNVLWKTPVPGVGHSSPIVWEDLIFVTTCVESDQSRRLFCIDRETGSVKWQQVVATCPIEKMHRDNTPASATPTTDGKHVFVTFAVHGKIQVAAYDFSGSKIWEVYPGTFESRHGYCTSLVLSENRLFVSGLQDGPDAFVAALDKHTGETMWKVPRRDQIRSFSSPLLCKIGETPALLLSGANQTVAYEQESGNVLWQTEGPASKTVSSIVICPENKLAFVCGGRDNGFLAISLSASESPAPKIAWKASKGIPYMTSPFTDHGFLHILSDEGVYRCYENKTGKVVKELRPVGPVRASMVATDQYIYVTEKTGKTTVIENNSDWRVVSENDLAEEVMASAAIVGGDFILRTSNHLVLIRE